MACLCGCGGEPANRTSKYLPGHDAKLRAKIEEAVGGLEPLKDLVEAHLGHSLD